MDVLLLLLLMGAGLGLANRSLQSERVSLLARHFALGRIR